jgi:hypothetical protein
VRLSLRKSLTCPFTPEYGPATRLSAELGTQMLTKPAAIFRQVRCQRMDRHRRIDRLAAKEAAW